MSRHILFYTTLNLLFCSISAFNEREGTAPPHLPAHVPAREGGAHHASTASSNVCSMCCIAIHWRVRLALGVSCHVALLVTSFVTHYAALCCGFERLACAPKHSSLIHQISRRESVLVNISSATLCFTPAFFMLGLFGDRFKG
jgi:hypothetical protein